MMNRTTYTVHYVQSGYEYTIYLEARSMAEAWDLAESRLPANAEVFAIDETAKEYQCA